MLFNSSAFIWFLAVILPIACVLKGRKLNIWLLLCSYYFYGYAEPRFLPLLLISTGVDYYAGSKIYASTGTTKRFWLCVSVVTNLSILIWFKYSGLLLDAVTSIAKLLEMDASSPTLNIVLPIGISFFTFQSMSYSIDIYLDKLRPHKSTLEFAHFVAFFPQLVAGPIVRAREFLPQISAARPLLIKNVIDGTELILLGFFKKVVIADNLAPAVDRVFANASGHSMIELWIAAFAFSIQIYCDFSGYTDIARGFAKTLGYELPINFKWPYFSVGFRDFWRRWHISLSSFIRDYLYIPLGGNRFGLARYCSNMAITWFICGLWHGANYTFIAWGLYNGLLIFIEVMWLRNIDALKTKTYLYLPIAMATTFVLTIFGWVMFRASSITEAMEYWSGMLGLSPASRNLEVHANLMDALFISVIFMFFHVATYRFKLDGSYSRLLANMSPSIRIAVISITISITVLLSGADRAFIYFQF